MEYLDPKKFGKWFMEQVRQAGLDSFRAVADATGRAVSPETVRKIAAGEMVPDDDGKLLRLAAAIHADKVDFLIAAREARTVIVEAKTAYHSVRPAERVMKALASIGEDADETRWLHLYRQISISSRMMLLGLAEKLAKAESSLKAGNVASPGTGEEMPRIRKAR
ncbi:MAG: hypothetical protein HY039_08970 [Nitrospirae bacterium]|nr:hypothetical protein [Nitrospirota bacterium]